MVPPNEREIAKKRSADSEALDWCHTQNAMGATEHTLRWRQIDGRSLEVVTISAQPTGARVRSDYLDAGSAPFSVRYEWILDAEWRTRSLSVRLAQGRDRGLAIERVGPASWRVDGSDRVDLDGCQEIDLAITPFSNTLALRRFAPAPGGAGELLALYVSFPDLTCSPSRQRYEQVDRDTFKYVDLGAHRGFEARLTVDGDGFVRTYQGLFELIEE